MKTHFLRTLLFAGTALSLHLSHLHVGRFSNALKSRNEDAETSPPEQFLVGTPVELQSSISDRDASSGPILASRATPAQSAEYTALVTSHHNLHRANHSAPALGYSSSLAGYAYTVASSCKFAHNLSPGGGGYGQNIAAIGGSGSGFTSQLPRAMAARAVTNQWYNSEVNAFLPSYYGKPTPDMSNFAAWGHFSQVVWKGTIGVGCWTQLCAPNTIFQGYSSFFTVCNYKAQGNVGGGYGTNVGVSLKKPTIVAP